MVRKTLYLTEEQMKAIQLLAKRQCKSRSEVIRGLIELGRQTSHAKKQAAWPTIEPF